ncbi:MAG TPA: SpoIVB peptidase S55 domain-containing protein, partial [Actinomycetota bacterium]|nr:SpoIVB peptidase S55 domain-containing protein [Actinomycetota bacterium]
MGALLASLLTAGPAPAATPCTNPPATFPTAQMVAGMTGVGYTVLRGDTIVPFDVQILGVIPDAFFLGVDVVAAKITGPASFLNETGGAVAGMSGSPIYLQGRLAGALAWAIAEDRQIFGMTAAEDMVGMFSLAGSTPSGAADRIALSPAIRRAARVSGSALPSTAVLETLPVPLGVSGMSGRPLTEFASLFADHGVRVSPFRAGSVPAPTAVTLDPRPLAPGDGFGVGLSYGDISAYGFGTTTAVCGDIAIAFGHPMFWGLGRVALGLNEVDVLAIDNGTFWGTKIGLLGDAHGIVNQDRFAGVAGVFGGLPPTIPVTSTVSSPDTGYGRTGRTDVAWDEDWFVADVAYSHAYSNLTYVAQADAPGTLAFAWTIEGTREDGSGWTVSNRLMEHNDYGAAGEVWRMADMLYTLAYQEYEPIEFGSIDMEGSITEENLTSPIVRVRVSSPLQPSLKERWVVRAAPGDRLTVEVTMDPVERDTDVVATLSMKVPHRARGYRDVVIKGGRGRFNWWRYPIETLDDLIAAMSRGDHHNDLIVKGLGPRIVQAQDVIVSGRVGFTVQVVR